MGLVCQENIKQNGKDKVKKYICNKGSETNE